MWTNCVYWDNLAFKSLQSCFVAKQQYNRLNLFIPRGAWKNYKPLLGPFCTTTFILAFFVPMLFVATHSYSPLSAGISVFMVRLPSFTSVLPTGKGIPNLVQLNTGSGNPTVWQVCRSVESSFGVTSNGGIEVKIGRPTKRKFKTCK